MPKLTIIQLKALKPSDIGSTLRDDGGLWGKVAKSKDGVSVNFYYRYRWEAKTRDISCGTWPHAALTDIRKARDTARDLVSQGVDAIAARKASRIENQKTVEAALAEAEQTGIQSLRVLDLFETWTKEGVVRKDKNKELIRQFEKDVLPALGHIELRKLTDTDIRAMLRKQLARGVVRTAIMAFNDLGQMLRWGEKRQPWRGLLTNGNPADLVDMENLVPDDYEEERNRILPPSEIQELADIFIRTTAAYNSAPTGTKHTQARPLKRESQLALWICLGTLCRIGELLMAKQEHINLEAGTWFVPRSNVKGRRQQRQEHTVFLSAFNRRHFAELLKLAGESDWLFPARNKGEEETHVCLKSVSKQIGDRQTRFKKRSKPLAKRRHDDSLVLADGVNGAWTPHDMRRTGATMMQSLGVPLEIIDRCQNHIIAGPKTRRHYLHHDYAAEKAEAWRKLGNRLDDLLTEKPATRELSRVDNVVDLPGFQTPD